MDLVFSDVWGHAPNSIGRRNYYVSFIDDQSKFVWIYLLKHKFGVFQCFRDFQKLVECQFDRKFVPFKQIGEGNIKHLTPFSSAWV